MTAAEQVLPARAGIAMRLDTGDRLRIVNTHGSQVVDLWAMAADDVLESMSTPHSRNPWFRLAPRPGDVLVTNLRRPILRLLEDSSPGVHDTLIPSCDSERYRQLGAPLDHGSCTDNFHSALRAIGIQVALKLRTSLARGTEVLLPDPYVTPRSAKTGRRTFVACPVRDSFAPASNVDSGQWVPTSTSSWSTGLPTLLIAQ